MPDGGTTNHIRAGVEYANSIAAARVLVICEAKNRADWLREIKERSVKPNPYCFAIVTSRYGSSETADWTVASPEILKPGILRGLVRQRFDLLLTTSALVHRIPAALIAACNSAVPCDRISDESVVH